MNSRSTSLLVTCLIAASVFFAFSGTASAATGWWNVGGISGVTTVEPYNESKNRSFAVSSTGAIYAAISDVTYGSGATVKKLTAGAWVVVGTPGFSSGAVYNPIIKVAPDGVPYVSYVDAANNYVTMVKKLVGNSWVDVGSASIVDPDRDGSSVPIVSRTDGSVRDFAIAPDGTPYLAINDSRGEE